MALYEIGIVLSTTFEEAERNALLDELRAIIVKEGAELVNENVWGKRGLAYEIKHQREGFYVFWKFNGAGPVVKALEFKLRVSELVLRYLTLNLDTEMRRARKMEKKRAEQKALKAAKEASLVTRAPEPVSQEAQ
jgi:small subunit ribosomal protein S6